MLLANHAQRGSTSLISRFWAWIQRRSVPIADSPGSAAMKRKVRYARLVSTVSFATAVAHHVRRMQSMLPLSSNVSNEMQEANTHRSEFRFPAATAQTSSRQLSQTTIAGGSRTTQVHESFTEASHVSTGATAQRKQKKKGKKKR
jgi:hypothetical protein